MSAAPTTPMLHQIRRLVEDERTRQRPDCDLLRQFVACRDEAAYQALVRRHGPMVLDVCRCLLANEADAEDAFQATFLILARRAGSVRKAASLGSWLHGVAYRTALKARAGSAKRRKHETQAPAREPVVGDDPGWREIQRVLHEELNALGDRQRAPLVLCYLQGKTQDEAAALLGVAKSTLKLRLERGRAQLRGRLVRRGLGPAAALLASAWPGAAAELPVHLAGAVVRAGALAAAGQPLAGIISAQVAALAEGGWTVLVGKAKATALGLILIAALGVGFRGLDFTTSSGEQLDAAVQARADNGPRRHKKDAKDDKALLQGVWVRVAEELNGEERPVDYLRTVEWLVEFKGDKVLFQWSEAAGPKPVVIEGTFVLEPDGKPKTITFADADNSRALGIYKIESDTLTICAGEFKGTVRPSAFETKEGTNHFLAVLKRRPDKKPAPKPDVEPQGKAGNKSADQELERLRGTWNVIGVEVDGKDDETNEAKLTIKKDKCTWERTGAAPKQTTLSVDPEKNPKTITFDDRGQAMPGIYELRGDSLKICYAQRGTTRPAKFQTTAGSDLVLLKLERAADQRNEDDAAAREQAAVRKALEYLAGKQNPDGSFGAEPWQHSVGLTATCGIALQGGEAAGLRAGGDALARALLYVTQHQQASGLLSHPQSKQAGVMYDHALATWFLASVTMHRKRDDLLPQLEKAVRLIEAAQNLQGGWRYLPVPKDADVTVTAIQVGALVAARNAGVKLKADTLSRAPKYLKACQTAEGGFAYQPGLLKSRFLYTAVALTALHQAGLLDDADRRRGTEYLLRRLPERSDYHDELVLGDGRLFAVALCGAVPDEQRDPLLTRIRASVLREQQADGSWLTTKKGDAVERTTALAVMTILEAAPRAWSASADDAPFRGIAPVPPTPEQKVSAKHPPRLAIEAPGGASWRQAVFLDNERILVGPVAAHRYEIRSAKTGALLKAFPEETDKVHLGRFRLSANRKWLAASTMPVVDPTILLLPYNYVTIWDVTTGKPRGASGGLAFNELLDIASDGRTTALLVGTPGQSRIEIWDLVTSELITNKRLKTAPFNLKGIGIDAAAFSPDGSMLVISARNTNYYWKWREEGEPVQIHVGRRIETLLFSPDGRLLVEGPGPRSDMDIRDLTTMRVIQSLSDEVKRSLTVDSMAFVDQGRTLVAGNTSTFIPTVKVPHRIHFWDVATGKLKRQIALEQGLPRSLDVSPDGKSLAVVIEPYRPQAAAHDHEPGQPGDAGHAHLASEDKPVLALWDVAATPPGATPAVTKP